MRTLTYKEQIEKLIEQWMKIDSAIAWNKWAEKIRTTKFGTYDTIPIEEVIKNTEVKFLNTYHKNEFHKEVKDAMRN